MIFDLVAYFTLNINSLVHSTSFFDKNLTNDLIICRRFLYLKYFIAREINWEFLRFLLKSFPSKLKNLIAECIKLDK